MARIRNWSWVLGVFFTVFCLATFAFSKAPAGYDHTASVKDKIFFHWKVDGKNLKVMVSGKTSGWLGIGFSPEKAMKGANIVIGYVKKGKVKIADHYGHREFNHKKDKKLGGKSNIKDKAGKEEGGVTEISFTMPLDSGDKRDKKIDPKTDTTVLLSYGQRDSFLRQHQMAAVLKVNLSTGKFSVTKIK